MSKWKPLLAAAPLAIAVCACFAQSGPANKDGKESEKGDAVRGKVVFIDHCEQCHEAESKDEKVGPGLKGTKDGRLPDGKPATHEKLLDIINTGPAEMPSFKERLTEKE